MGRPLGPGGSGEFLKIVYLMKKNKNTGKVRQRTRRSDENIIT